MRKACMLIVCAALIFGLAAPVSAGSITEEITAVPPSERTADVDIAYVEPISPSDDATPTVCYWGGSYWESYVEFYWSDNGGNTWNFWDYDPNPGPLSGVYQITVPLPGEGTYHFAAVGDLEPAPTGPADIDHGPWQLIILESGEPPISHVLEMGNWAEFSPWQLTATALASGSVASVELWWKSDINPVWTIYDVDYAEPWEWYVSFPTQYINYYFYSIAVDDMGLREAAPPVPDTWCVYILSHYPSTATGPVGTSTSASLTVTYEPDCGCFGYTSLYYSTDRNATWHYIGTDPSDWDESGFWSWTAPGSGEYWWYAANGWTYGIDEDPPGPGTPAEAGPYTITLPPQPHYDIPIVAGWNLISFPVNASGSPGTVLADYGGDTTWDVVKWYDGATKIWKSYRVGSSANTLTYIDRTMGLWVHVTALGDGVLGIIGEPLGIAQISLYAGWNLVGYPSLTPRTAGETLMGTNWERAEVFDPAPPYIIPVGPDYVLNPGQGLWVKVPANTVWIVN